MLYKKQGAKKDKTISFLGQSMGSGFTEATAGTGNDDDLASDI